MKILGVFPKLFLKNLQNLQNLKKIICKKGTWTCYLLSKKTTLCISARKAQVTERRFKLIPIHASDQIHSSFFINLVKLDEINKI